ncbi:MAG: PIN domain-containing protein [Dysosmobacter welbionis]
MKMIFLVDGDNNIGTGLQGIDLLTAEDTVLVFFGKGQTLANVKKLCAGTKAQVQYLESVKGGKNSLDFQIITELGVLVGEREADFAYVISQDKGYEAAMSALHARYASTFREVALRPSIQDCLQAAFLLRAGTREELAAALARQYGPVQGQLAYEHLEALLTRLRSRRRRPLPAPENKAASKPGKRRSRAAAKPAETAEPAPAQSAPQDAEEPAGTAEPAAPAARSRRSGASRRRKRAERSKAEKA